MKTKRYRVVVAPMVIGRIIFYNAQEVLKGGPDKGNLCKQIVCKAFQTGWDVDVTRRGRIRVYRRETGHYKQCIVSLSKTEIKELAVFCRRLMRDANETQDTLTHARQTIGRLAIATTLP
jgi:hypothetical protein